VGYRINVRGDVLNVLRWQTPAGDARTIIPPDDIQALPPFLGQRPPIVTRAEFAGTGFTGAHLAGVRFHGYRVPSTLVTEVRNLLRAGEPFVYTYYDGIDKVAHEYGLADHYDAELVAADRLVADLIAVLPPGAALVVTSDHGQVQVGEAVVGIHDDVMEHVELLSGEGRFRWLHARPGRAEHLAEAARGCHAKRAWVRTRAEVIAEEWFGPKVSDVAAARFGDVVLAARDAVAFEDPADTGPYRLQSRHGSLTSAEMRIPLLAHRA
jgi:predicted AlkP superfamily pyrophosphatase or phosphodiesterase